MTEVPVRPKDEKEEKAEEKQEEKTEEKSFDEKYRRDPLGTITWAAILIWAGLVLLAENLGWVATVGRSLTGIRGLHAAELSTWSFILMGAGVLILIESLVRVLVPAYRRPVTGSVILGAILIAVGLGSAVSWTIVGPVILIAIGVLLLLQSVLRKR